MDITDRDQPHFIKSSVLNFGFLWPNQYHVPYKEYQRNLRTTSVSEGSNDTFANTEWSPGPSSPTPNYNSLSPCPPHLPSAEEKQQEQQIDLTTTEIIQAVNERIGQAHSITKELARTLYWVCQSQGEELDQFTFREGGLTYHQLQQIDQINHLELYSKATDTAVAGPSSQFQEGNQHQEGEEQEEHSEEEQPLYHPLRIPELMQQDTSNGTQISEGSLTTSIGSETIPMEETPIVHFLNEEEWTLWLNKQLDRVFH